MNLERLDNLVANVNVEGSSPFARLQAADSSICGFFIFCMDSSKKSRLQIIYLRPKDMVPIWNYWPLF